MLVTAAARGFFRFRRLPASFREFVFYSEASEYWCHFQPIVDALLKQRKVTVVSSDRKDPVFQKRHDNLQTCFIGAGFFRILWFQTVRAKIMIMTMPDLHNIHLKRSAHSVHYVYVFHSLMGANMSYRERAFHHYDSFLCAGRYHTDELQAIERHYRLPPKHYIAAGYARLNALFQTAPKSVAKDPPAVLYAPSWGEALSLNQAGNAIVTGLLGGGYEVIFRPHPRSCRLSPQAVRAIVNRHREHPQFHYRNDVNQTDDLIYADVLVTDWSGIGMEYVFGLEKPVVFIDTPPKVRNPRYRDIGVAPIEDWYRREVGELVAMNDIGALPAAVGRALAGDRRAAWRRLREACFFNMDADVGGDCAHALMALSHTLAAADKNAARVVDGGKE